MEIGTESSTSRVSTLWVRTFTMSTIGLAPVTVIVSSSAPTRSSAFTFAVNPTVSSIPSRTTLAKPGNVNATEYAPGRRAVIWYRPEPSLTPKRLPPGKDGLVASTVTPGSTPPVASVTTPEMAPLSCARTAPGEATNTSKAVSVIRDRLLSVVILCPLPVRIVRGELNYYLSVRVFSARLWPLQYPLFLAVTSLTRHLHDQDSSDIWILIRLLGETEGLCTSSCANRLSWLRSMWCSGGDRLEVFLQLLPVVHVQVAVILKPALVGLGTEGADQS